MASAATTISSQAKAGQIVMSERVFGETGGRYPDSPQLQLDLKGKSQPVAARVIEVKAPA